MTNIELLLKLQELQLIQATNQAPLSMPRNALRRDGVSQSERFPAALAPDYFRIDERELDQLLELTWKLAGQIRFQDGADGDRLDWRAFFRKDLSVMLAKIVRYQLDGWRKAIAELRGQVQEHLADLQSTPTTEYSSEAKAAFRDLVTWVRQGSSEFRSPMDRIYRWQLRLPIGHSLAIQVNAAMYSVVNPAGAMADEAEQLILGDCASPLQRSETAGRAYELLSRAIEMLAQECALLQVSARRHFATSLTDFPSHSPHAGLFIAFLQLLRVAQGRLNELGPAQLDFYFREVLRFSPRGVEEDRVHLVGTVNPATAKVLIPKGTRFSAKNGRIYTTKQEWSLCQAAIARQLGARWDGQQLLAMGGDAATTPAGLWPANPQLPTSQLGRLGFAVSSHMLRMSNGRGYFFIYFAAQSQAAPSQTLTLDTVRGLFDRAQIRYSSPAGWQTITPLDVSTFIAGTQSGGQYSIPEELSGRRILWLGFELTDEMPGLVDLNPKKHGSDLPEGLPTLEFRFATDDHALASQLGAAYPIDRWGIAVNFFQRDPAIRNSAGPVNLRGQAKPFGEVASVGSKFWIDLTEAMSKRPRTLRLELQWKNGPDFREYYVGYSRYLQQQVPGTPDIEQSSFKVIPSLMVNGLKLGAAWGEQLLFNPDFELTLSTEPESQTRVKPEWLPQFPSMEAARTLDYGIFLQLELNRPTMGFGHELYPKVYADAMYRMQRSLANQQKDAPAVNLWIRSSKPTSPSSPSLLWSGRVNTLPGRGGPGRALPMKQRNSCKWVSGDTAFPSLQAPANLVQVDEGQASLYLGLEGVLPNTQVSLLVQLRPGSGDSALPLPAIQWSILVANEWQPLLASQLPIDQTNGLRGSGVLAFNLLDLPDLNQTLMPAGLLWLRASCQGEASALDLVQDIHCNGFEVVLSENPGNYPSPLAAGSITKAAQWIAGLKEISQPYGSIGGKAAQSISQFQTSVSERLRHKNRTVTLWDYERMVLEANPEVDRVKCIPNAPPEQPLGDGQCGAP
ncbi:MAG: hypothetical protein U0176_12715 [Bacteroidia bacterium]